MSLKRKFLAPRSLGSPPHLYEHLLYHKNLKCPVSKVHSLLCYAGQFYHIRQWFLMRGDSAARGHLTVSGGTVGCYSWSGVRYYGHLVGSTPLTVV